MPSPRRLSPLLALVGAALLGATPHAEAGSVVIGTKVKEKADGGATLHTVVVEDSAGAVQRVVTRVASDAGRELRPATESDAWQHGAAGLRTVPSTRDRVRLRLYSVRSVELVAYTGSFDDTGRLGLTTDPGEFVCTARGCGYAAPPDVEVLAAETFQSGDVLELGLDLVGADVPEVAYGELELTPCTPTAEPGRCLYRDADTTISEVAWDGLGSVWSTDLGLTHEGALNVQVRVSAEGSPVMTSSTTLAVPWEDGAEGVSTLAADADPLTTVGLLEADGQPLLAVVSEGWTVGTAPASAKLALSDGSTVSMTPDSYQRRAPELLFAPWDETLKEYMLVIDGSSVTINGGSLSFSDLSSPLCVEGTCVVLRTRGDEVAMSVSQYRWDTAFIAGETNVVLKAVGADGTVTLVDEVFTFEEEVSVVFANEVSFEGDPLRAGLSARVNLYDARGTDLAGGRVQATVDRRDDGGLGLTGVGPGEIAAMPATSFAVLLSGPSTSCGDEESGWVVPPPLAAVAGNGSGTKNPHTTTSAKPRLL